MLFWLCIIYVNNDFIDSEAIGYIVVIIVGTYLSVKFLDNFLILFSYWDLALNDKKFGYFEIIIDNLVKSSLSMWFNHLASWDSALCQISISRRFYYDNFARSLIDFLKGCYSIFSPNL